MYTRDTKNINYPTGNFFQSEKEYGYGFCTMSNLPCVTKKKSSRDLFPKGDEDFFQGDIIFHACGIFQITKFCVKNLHCNLKFIHVTQKKKRLKNVKLKIKEKYLMKK